MLLIYPAGLDLMNGGGCYEIIYGFPDNYDVLLNWERCGENI